MTRPVEVRNFNDLVAIFHNAAGSSSRWSQSLSIDNNILCRSIEPQSNGKIEIPFRFIDTGFFDDQVIGESSTTPSRRAEEHD